MLAVRTCLDVFRDVSVHAGPLEVLPHKLDCPLLSEVSCHFAAMFSFEDGRYHELGNVKASSIEENVVGFHCLMIGWFEIIGAISVSAGGTQT